jgi:regulator of sigma E protease
VSDLSLLPAQRAEIDDWQHEAGLQGAVQELSFIPYNLNTSCVVEAEVSYLNARSTEELPSSGATPLLVGDQIIAVDGLPIHSCYELLAQLQRKHVQLMVERGAPPPVVSWKKADTAFTDSVDWAGVGQLARSVGVADAPRSQGTLHLLTPIEPRPFQQLPLSEKKRLSQAREKAAALKRIEEMTDPELKVAALAALEKRQNPLSLGLATKEGAVRYNPPPLQLFCQVWSEVWQMLVALVTGVVAPKYMVGPVGIMQMMHSSWNDGFSEALYWLGMISLNLGFLNLLPLPVLDGGHLCFTLWEWCTGKPIREKTRERLIIPFVVLLIALLLYFTYNDLIRLFSGLFTAG